MPISSRRRHPIGQRDPRAQRAAGVVDLGLRQIERVFAFDIARAHVVADREADQPQSASSAPAPVPARARSTWRRWRMRTGLPGPTTRLGVALKNSSGARPRRRDRSAWPPTVDSSMRADLLRV